MPFLLYLNLIEEAWFLCFLFFETESQQLASIWLAQPMTGQVFVDIEPKIKGLAFQLIVYLADLSIL